MNKLLKVYNLNISFLLNNERIERENGEGKIIR